MASSLVSSAYFPTRPVLGSNAHKVMTNVTGFPLEGVTRSTADGEDKALEDLKVAEHQAHTSKGGNLDEAKALAESVQQAAESVQTEAAAQLVLANIHFKTGKAQDAHEAADQALALLADQRDKSHQAKAFHGKALAHFLTDDMSRAIKGAQKALALYKETGDEQCQLFEMLCIAQWQLSASKPSASLHTAKSARALARRLDSPTEEASALFLMCDSLAQSGRRAQAVTTAKDGLAQLKASNDNCATVCGHSIVIYSLMSSENPVDAVDAAQDALRYVQTLDDKELEIDVQYMKCQAHLKNREEEEAAKSMRNASSLARDLSDPIEEAAALRMVSFALSNMDLLDQETVILREAIEAADEAKSLYKSAGVTSGEASSLMMLAVLNSQKEDADVDLVSMVQEAKELYNDVQDAVGEHGALNLLADLHMQAKQYETALEFANSSVELWARVGNRKAQAYALQSVANVYVTMEDFEEAETQIAEAQKLSCEVGVKRLEASLSILLTKVYLEEGVANKDQEQELRVAAMTASAKALLFAGQTGEKDLWAIALIWRSQVLSWAGRSDEAMSAAEKAEKAFAELKDLPNQVRAMIKMAELFRTMSKKADARQMANKALDCANDNPECAALVQDAQAVIDSMAERRQVQRSGGGGRTERRLVKKWRKKGASAAVVKTMDPKATMDKIKTLVMNVLTEDEDLEPDVPFMEAGVDSLGSVQLVTDVGKAFQMPLAPSIVFDYPTIRVLSEHLVEESGAAAGDAAGGGEDEWEEYEDWEDVAVEGDGGDYMMIEAPQQGGGSAVVPAAASAAVPAQPKGLDAAIVQKKLMELVKNVLTDDDEELHMDMPFMEAGIDSLGSVQLVTDVGKAFQMPLAPSIVFDYPSISSLCEHLVEESKG